MNNKNPIDDKTTEEINLYLKLIGLEVKLQSDLEDTTRLYGKSEKLARHYAHEAEIKLLKASGIIKQIKKVNKDFNLESQEKHIREIQKSLHLITNESYIN
jgi:hypothetical protein